MEIGNMIFNFGNVKILIWTSDIISEKSRNRISNCNTITSTNKNSHYKIISYLSTEPPTLLFPDAEAKSV